MGKKQKRITEEVVTETPSKKLKKSENTKSNLEKSTDTKKSKKNKLEKPTNETLSSKKTKKIDKPTEPGKQKSFTKKNAPNLTEKPEDWNEFKKKKKEIREKRKQGKNLYDVTVQAKKIGEKLRLKTLKGGENERNKLTQELHDLLGGKGDYPKLVMTHDMARIVQYMLKYGSPSIRKDIAKELTSIAATMLQSKYAKFCVKRMLKYGDNETRAGIMKACYGKAVKLASHAVSAAIFNYGFTTWATALEKQHIVQEFYGDIYKQSKDDSVKHIKDVYEKSPDMKIAALGAMKANLQRILNKELLDSHLVQTVLMQFLQECTPEDRSELISQLASHIVILSNSKEGCKAAMICVLYGTNKDRKVCIKALKEHIVDLSSHEHGHNTVITVLDTIDDTVLVNKTLLGDIVTNAAKLAADEWGRKVLLWLVAPEDPAHFHPTFIAELNEAKEKSTSKKSTELRRKELLNFISAALLKQISEDVNLWLTNSSIALVTLSILKSGNGLELETTLKTIADHITDPDWTVKDGEADIPGIEHTGIHMMLKKLIQADKTAENKFGEILIEKLNDVVVKKWIKINRGCFILVSILENSSEDVQTKLTDLLNSHKKLIQKEKSTGAKVLIKKIK